MVELNEDQKRAITALKRLAKNWPDGLSLFSWNGTLCVILHTDAHAVSVATIEGIPNDGGDPDHISE